MSEKLPPPPQWLIEAVAAKKNDRQTLPQTAREAARALLKLPARKPKSFTKRGAK